MRVTSKSKLKWLLTILAIVGVLVISLGYVASTNSIAQSNDINTGYAYIEGQTNGAPIIHAYNTNGTEIWTLSTSNISSTDNVGSPRHAKLLPYKNGYILVSQDSDYHQLTYISGKGNVVKKAEIDVIDNKAEVAYSVSNDTLAYMTIYNQKYTVQVYDLNNLDSPTLSYKHTGTVEYENGNFYQTSIDKNGDVKYIAGSAQKIENMVTVSQSNGDWVETQNQTTPYPYDITGVSYSNNKWIVSSSDGSAIINASDGDDIDEYPGKDGFIKSSSTINGESYVIRQSNDTLIIDDYNGTTATVNLPSNDNYHIVSSNRHGYMWFWAVYPNQQGVFGVYVAGDSSVNTIVTAETNNLADLGGASVGPYQLKAYQDTSGGLVCSTLLCSLGFNPWYLLLLLLLLALLLMDK